MKGRAGHEMMEDMLIFQTWMYIFLKVTEDLALLKKKDVLTGDH